MASRGPKSIMRFCGERTYYRVHLPKPHLEALKSGIGLVGAHFLWERCQGVDTWGRNDIEVEVQNRFWERCHDPPLSFPPPLPPSHQFRPHPQYVWDFPEEIPEIFRKDPETLSQSFSCNSPQEYGWDPPSPIIQGIGRLQSISRIPSPPRTAGDTSFFQKWFRRGPLRAGHGILSSTGGISDESSSFL